MDMRSWPWKKKSSDKIRIEKALSSLEAPNSSTVYQDNYKKPNYVQLSLESYSHLTGLEDQIKTYEDQVNEYKDQVNTHEDKLNEYKDHVKALEDEVKEANDKLFAAQTEITNKEALVKQHTKFGEDAVSGWEKTEAEALSLKTHLESVTLLKLAAEDRSSRLDEALKECLNQIRSLQEDHQREVHEIILTKTKQYDKIKFELEGQIGNLTQQLLRAEAENDAVSRSLHERSNKLFKVSEEKSRAEAEIELLKSNLESSGKEINSFKYELHIAKKEFEIRNEEKNMAVKSAEAANKQHLEDVKKISKLEAEVQRLRGLVRKKLPGPAAMAQMKLEVENLEREYGETTKKSPVKSVEYTLDSLQKTHKENEFLTKRLLAMEEETKMLKEALAKRNSELLASRNYCAQTVNKLRSLESDVEANNRPKITSSPSISEDGNDDQMSCSESISGLSISKKAGNGKHIQIMDDFLAMEKLAYSPEGLNIADMLHEKSQDTKSSSKIAETITEELRISMSSIRDFVLILEDEAKSGESIGKIQGFCATYAKLMRGEIGLTEVILDLSSVLNKASGFKLENISCRNNEDEINGSDCIDKVAIPEDKDIQDSNLAKYSNRCAQFLYTVSDPSNPNQGSCFSAEELKRKLEKDSMVLELSRCLEDLERTKRLLEEAKMELASAQKLNSLSDTQLKCMAQSYKSLEIKAEKLQTEVDHLQDEIENIKNELEEERRRHKVTLEKCNNLEQELQRYESCPLDTDVKHNQERDLAAATDKLTECQETIFLLGKQLKSLRCQTDFNVLSTNKRVQKGEASNGTHSLDFDQMVRETLSNETPVEIFNSSSSPSNTEPNSPVSSPIKPKHIKHRYTKSGSSSSSSGLTPEKHSRAYTRFFSGKGENGC